ncbi:MAG TPA: MarR family transcriptional regulator [Acidobacteriaceae bacterium]|jgi:DNA-binding MarR family transcriptional regulator|nr:MarR family transcriptional regulator [Acidobacteriaceae bacterium]
MAPPHSIPAPGTPSQEEALFIELVRTADRLSRGSAQLLREHDLSPAPYNVLRILRGAPDGLLCGEIAARMITREPDITRLLDRLEKRALIGRCREDQDRRRILVRITPAGLALLSRLDEPIQEVHRRQLGHLSRKQLREFLDLLAAARRGLA